MKNGRTPHPTALLIAATAVCYVLDLVKDAYLYGRFGPGALDAYFGALTMWDSLLNLLMFSALGSVLLPVLADAEREGGAETAGRMANTLQAVSCAVLLAAAIVAAALAPALLRLYRIPVTAINVSIVQCVLVALPAFGAEKIFRAMLERRGRFGATAGASLAARAVFLAVVFGLAGRVGALSAGLGSLVAAAIAVAVLAVSLGRMNQSRTLPLGHPLVRRAWALLLPVGLAGMLAQSLLVSRWYASQFGEGSVSLLRLGWALCEVPAALFCVSVATAVFPRMCESAASGDRRAVQEHLAAGLRRALYFTLPTLAGFLALAGPLVRVVYQRGLFSGADSAAASAVLMAYSAGLAAAAMRPLLDRAIFAARAHRWLVLVEAVTLACTAALGGVLAFVLGWGLVGIALGAAAALWAGVLIRWWLVRRTVGTEYLGAMWHALAKMTLCAGATGVACLLLWRVTAPPGDPGTVIIAARLGLTVVFGAAFYLLLTALAGLEEYADARGLIRKYLRFG